MQFLTCELGSAVDVIHKVLATMIRVPDLPGLAQGAELFLGDLHPPEARVVPCAHAGGEVNEVDLPLGRLPLL